MALRLYLTILDFIIKYLKTPNIKWDHYIIKITYLLKHIINYFSFSFINFLLIKTNKQNANKKMEISYIIKVMTQIRIVSEQVS